MNARLVAWTLGFMLISAVAANAADQRPLIDTHIHYSHDAWDMLPPAEAIRVLRKAGLKSAFVSSSSDDGTQMLFKQAPDLIVPVLRPYRKRGEISSWFQDPTVVDMISDRLAKNTYAGIGEFHIFGDFANLPVMKAVVQLAKKYGLFLHAHSDAEAVSNIFAQNPEALVLWAHSGFAEPDEVGDMLARYPNLWTDLAFRTEHATTDTVDPEWRNIFLKFPDRFMIGTDTFAPERWYYVIEHAEWTRSWLQDLPADVADRIAWKNARALADKVLKK
jgi:hypothetical protein